MIMRQNIISRRLLALTALLGVAVLCPDARAQAQWQLVGSAGFSAAGATDTSLAFYNGEPYVAYQDVADRRRGRVLGRPGEPALAGLLRR